MKKVLFITLTVLMCLVLGACSPTQSETANQDDTVNHDEIAKCSHSFSEATCYAPQECILCGEIKGNALEHQFSEATCNSGEVCQLCHYERGSALPHQWDGTETCAKGATCTLCGIENQERKDHTYQKNVCSVCGDKMIDSYTELDQYLTKNYSKIVTPLGDITGVSYNVKEKHPATSNCDYELIINSDLTFRSQDNQTLGMIISNEYYSFEDRVNTLVAVINFEYEISKIAMDAFPNKKMKGCFFDSGYEYASLKVGYWDESQLCFCNFDGPYHYEVYSSTTLTHWNVQELAGEQLTYYSYEKTAQWKQFFGEVIARTGLDLEFAPML